MGKFQDLMDRELRIRGLAENTRRSYLEKMRRFVRHFMRAPDQLTAEDVKQYQLFLTKDRRVTWSTFNVNVCAIRFFYRNVLRVEWNVEHIPYQKTGTRLPVVLSGEEVIALLDAATNLKHRAILMTLYSAGLRTGEAIHLRLEDIDSQRMMIRVEQGKGRQDRYVMLSRKLLETLRRYWLMSRPDPWLFPGQVPTHPITYRSVDRIFACAKAKAGIRKRVVPHSLRHSFATHLLERGVNIRVIQRLLGHRNLRSTEVYTHVAESYIRDTKSPLDDLLPDTEGVEPLEK
jgi:site-specific recombinase XerD